MVGSLAPMIFFFCSPDSPLQSILVVFGGRPKPDSDGCAENKLDYCRVTTLANISWGQQTQTAKCAGDKWKLCILLYFFYIFSATKVVSVDVLIRFSQQNSVVINIHCNYWESKFTAAIFLCQKENQKLSRATFQVKFDCKKTFVSNAV